MCVIVPSEMHFVHAREMEQRVTAEEARGRCCTDQEAGCGTLKGIDGGRRKGHGAGGPREAGEPRPSEPGDGGRETEMLQRR